MFAIFSILPLDEIFGLTVHSHLHPFSSYISWSTFLIFRTRNLQFTLFPLSVSGTLYNLVRLVHHQQLTRVHLFGVHPLIIILHHLSLFFNPLLIIRAVLNRLSRRRPRRSRGEACLDFRTLW